MTGRSWRPKPKPGPRKKRGPEPVPEGVVLALEIRSFGMCEGCGLRRATEIHHRKFRSRGGDNSIENLLHLCGWGNHTGCHGAAHGGGTEEERLRAIGWAVKPDETPADVVLLYRGKVRYLTEDGDVINQKQYDERRAA